MGCSTKMYDFNRQVYIKSIDQVGFIGERNYVTVAGKRKAQYLVYWQPRRRFIEGKWITQPTQDFLTGSEDLRPADFCCDSCSRWLPGYPASQYRNPWDGEVEAQFCFLCTRGIHY